MNIIQALLMGIIQGLTEFLPVSSSAHIVLVSNLYKVIAHKELSIGIQEEVFFDIIIHLGTLLAIFIYFKDDILELIKNFFLSIKNRDFSTPQMKLPWFILLGTVVTVFLALPLKDITEQLVQTPYLVGIFLIGTSIILMSSEIYSKYKKETTGTLNWIKAIAIGFAQGMAVFPGLSRSGLTISTGLFCGLDKVVAARYSFLLSIPVILGASLFYPLSELDFAQLSTFNWHAILIGFLSSAIVGYFCIKYFMQFLSKYSMKVFAFYCFIVGILMYVGFRFFL